MDRTLDYSKLAIGDRVISRVWDNSSSYITYVKEITARRIITEEGDRFSRKDGYLMIRSAKNTSVRLEKAHDWEIVDEYIKWTAANNILRAVCPFCSITNEVYADNLTIKQDCCHLAHIWSHKAIFRGDSTLEEKVKHCYGLLKNAYAQNPHIYYDELIMDLESARYNYAMYRHAVSTIDLMQQEKICVRCHHKGMCDYVTIGSWEGWLCADETACNERFDDYVLDLLEKRK